MSYALGFGAAVLLHLALRSTPLWWLLAAAQPLLLVAATGTRRFPPAQAGWLGLGCGLAMDLLEGRPLGPGGIAAAAGAAAVAWVVTRLELAGPLFWVTAALLLAALYEALRAAVLATLGAAASHTLAGSLAVVATAGLGGLGMAAGERAWAWWRSPERRRRRALRRAAGG